MSRLYAFIWSYCLSSRSWVENSSNFTVFPAYLQQKAVKLRWISRSHTHRKKVLIIAIFVSAPSTNNVSLCYLITFFAKHFITPMAAVMETDWYMTVCHADSSQNTGLAWFLKHILFSFKKKIFICVLEILIFHSNQRWKYFRRNRCYRLHHFNVY